MEDIFIPIRVQPPVKARILRNLSKFTQKVSPTKNQLFCSHYCSLTKGRVAIMDMEFPVFDDEELGSDLSDNALARWVPSLAVAVGF